MQIPSVTAGLFHKRLLSLQRWYAGGARAVGAAGVAGGVPCPPRRYSAKAFTSPGMKVAICGAAGCTGQPLALLLKQSPLLDEVALYDVRPTCGAGTELNHVDTRCRVTSYSCPQHIACALEDAKVVVIVARDCDDSFESNAPVMTELAVQICNHCPDAFTIVGTEPVESLVPLVAELRRLRGGGGARRLLGCVELHAVRANTALADFLNVPPEQVRVPVIGGATPQTMVPVLSAALHPNNLTQEQVECLTSCIMSGNETVREAKGRPTGTACLAGAYALARTTLNVVKGLQGKGTTQVGYVDSCGTCAPDCQFFATEVDLGPSGIEKVHGIPELTKFENCLLCSSLPLIRNEIARAVWLVYSMCNQPMAAAPGPCAGAAAAPPNWNSGHPDEYLATICREMTSRYSEAPIQWLPREAGCGAAGSLAHQMPGRSAACPASCAPPSVRYADQQRRRPKPPCTTC
ncbi:hypothetical protein JYU34_006035 [Plutella xylostella]|uniref:Malate dehydrogenase, mitochondrial n=1 Tax=Plutella xylostella TaxID=51655 RepID=A0ABQ7QUR5_PLUXY|nr:hypothetical protein JYU34_006035 [Plutella xylostella]